MAALEPDVVEIAEDCVGQALNEGSVDFMAAIGNVVSRQLSAAKSEPSHDLLGAVAEGVNSQAFSEVEAVVILHALLSAGWW
jgi:hypothetical protein